MIFLRLSGSMNLCIMQSKIKIIVFTNSAWALYKFRLGLIDKLSSLNYSISLIFPFDDIYTKRIQEKYECYNINLSQTGTNVIREIISLTQLFFLVKKIKPDFILSFSIKPNIYANIVAKLYNVRTINNISGLGTVFIQGGLRLVLIKLLYKMTLNSAYRIFFQNSTDISFFKLNFNFNQNKIALLPGSGVNLNTFSQEVTSKYIETSDEFKFLFIGRIIKEKGVYEYFYAAKQMKEKYGTKVVFYIAGDRCAEHISNIPNDEFKKWISSEVLDYLGYLEDIRPSLAQCDCVVLPSYREGMPRSILEAFAMKKPAIVAKVPGSTDIIDDGINGLHCEPKSTKSLYLKLNQMYNMSKQKRKKMGLKGYAKVKEFFDEEIVFNKYIETIKEK